MFYFLFFNSNAPKIFRLTSWICLQVEFPKMEGKSKSKFLFTLQLDQNLMQCKLVACKRLDFALWWISIVEGLLSTTLPCQVKLNIQLSSKLHFYHPYTFNIQFFMTFNSFLVRLIKFQDIQFCLCSILVVPFDPTSSFSALIWPGPESVIPGNVLRIIELIWTIYKGVTCVTLGSSHKLVQKHLYQGMSWG